MRIYYVTLDTTNDLNAGSVRYKYLSNSLRGNHEVITVSHSKATGIDTVCLPCERPSNIMNFSQRVLREFWFSFVSLIYLLFKCREDDIVVVTPPPFLMSISTSILPLFRKIKLIIDIRDLYPDVYIQSGLMNENGILSKFLRLLEKYSYNRAYLIITVTAALKKRIEARTSTSVETIYNGYERFLPREKKLRPGPLKVVMHGNFGKFQDVDLINSITKECEFINVRFSFIGFGSRFDLLEKRDNVDIFTTMSHDDLYQYLSKCHIGVSIRTNDLISKEAFPVKLFEYVGIGLFSISTPKSEAGAMLEKRGLGKQFHNDKSEIVNFIKNAVSNENLIQIHEGNRLFFSREIQSNNFTKLLEKKLFKKT